MTNNIFQFISLRKILIVFVLVFLGTNELVSFVIERLQGVSSATAGLSNSWLAASRAIGDAATHDASEVKHQAQLFERAYKEYQPTIAPGEECGLAESMIKAWQHYHAPRGSSVTPATRFNFRNGFSEMPSNLC